MQKKSFKVAALAALTGTVCGLGFGCLGNGIWGRILWDTALDIGQEFVLDNDSIFDLFEDGEPTATDGG